MTTASPPSKKNPPANPPALFDGIRNTVRLVRAFAEALVASPRRAGRAATGALHLAVSLALTWPLAVNLTSQIPIGTESSQTVPLFNLWVLGWNATWLSTPGVGYWDAPIFHPVGGSFAFSDPQPLTGLLAAPLWFLSPALAYNAILILFLTLNGIAVGSLLRARGLAPVPALMTGFLAQALPFVTHERGVLQLQPIFGIVWTIDQVWRVAEKARLRNGLGVGLAGAVTYLTSGYYALFLVVMLFPALAVLSRRLANRRAVGALLAGVALAGGLTAPVAIVQKAYLAEMGFTRVPGEIQRFSASPSDYLRRSPALLSSGSNGVDDTVRGNYLSPGFAVAALSFVGATWMISGRRRLRFVVFLLLAGFLAFGLSLGFNSSAGDLRPYDWVRAAVPGMTHLRSPFRFGLCVQLAAVLLAGCALQAVYARGRKLLTVSLAVLALIEAAPSPSRMTRVPTLPRMSGIDSPAAFIPFVRGRTSRDYFKTVAAMCFFLPSGVRLVNGYSGYFPLLNSQLQDLLADFPTARGLSALQALGVRTVLVEVDSLPANRRSHLAQAVDRGILQPGGSTLGISFYKLAQSSFRPIGAYARRWNIAIQALPDELEVALSPADLGRTMFVVAPPSATIAWDFRVTGPLGDRTIYRRGPAGARLIYRDQAELRIRLPRPAASGMHFIEVRRPGNGDFVGQTSINLTSGGAQ